MTQLAIPSNEINPGARGKMGMTFRLQKMCAEPVYDAVLADLESVPLLFTMLVFEVRQAEQDGGGNIYMAKIYLLS